MMTKRVAIIGTQGVPAHYGGFESLVENIIGEHQSPDVDYTVFCSSPLMDRSLPRYKGAVLKYVGINAHGATSVAYDIVSMFRCLRHYDVILILGVSGCICLPLLKRMTRARIIVNIDGHEYRRSKWGWFAKTFLRLSERFAVGHSDTVVTDNEGIRRYVARVYGRQATLIAYGGDQVIRTVPLHRQQQILDNYRVTAGQYACAICRIEPENNCHIILEAARLSGHPLAFVGNWGHSEYSQKLYEEYGSDPDIRLLDAIYDLDILYALRHNARCYLHGHSAGGTNPSLVEAMFFGRPVIAYDCVYNRETTFRQAAYFNNSLQLADILQTDLKAADKLAMLAREHYSWASVARCYETLY